MDCDTAREALSARIDGEREPLPAARVDEHLAACPPCLEWNAAAIEQTRLLRRVAGRAQVAAVRTPGPPPQRWWAVREIRPVSWRRWALGAVGVLQVGLAVAQGLGADLGLPHAATAGHVLHESTAWSAAVGVAMAASAARPAMSGGLAWVLIAFSALLAGYEIADAGAGRIGMDRPLTHLPVLAGAVLAVLVWRRDGRPGRPRPDLAAGASGEIVLPDKASRGRRRRHLRPSDAA